MTEIEPLRAYLLQQKEATEDQPFGPEVLVFKVCGKMFALFNWQERPIRINLKCDPFLAEILRKNYDAVLPGFHMNKRHWNTVILDGSIPEDEVQDMINESYALVVKGLRKIDRDRLKA